jgi:hypothetical protein
MAAALAPLAARFGVEVIVVDVDAHPALEARYGERVPVVLLGDRARRRGALPPPPRPCRRDPRARSAAILAVRRVIRMAIGGNFPLKFKTFRKFPAPAAGRAGVLEGTAPPSMQNVRNFLDHRAHRPRQVDARRSLHPALWRPVRPRDERAGAGLDGPRARARDHIKAQTAALIYKARDGETYQLHLIDTPGHVDFAYEVSRSLAACEGALLVVDASQGVEAQTVANCYTAIEQGVTVVPVLNKIDLPSAEPSRVMEEIEDIIGIPAHDAVPRQRQDGRGHRRHPRGGHRPHSAAQGRPGRAAEGADHRLVVRQLRRRRHARPRDGRHAAAEGQDPADGEPRDVQLRAGRRVHAALGAARAAHRRDVASSSPASRSSRPRR